MGIFEGIEKTLQTQLGKLPALITLHPFLNLKHRFQETMTTPAPPSMSSTDEKPKPAADKDPKESSLEEEKDDAAEDIGYTPYKPAKLGFGHPHPDPIVENATLAAVEPPDITYNLAMPADVIQDAKLSNLQLEAIVYGCQRHRQDVPRPPPKIEDLKPKQEEKREDSKPDSGALRGSKRKKQQSAKKKKEEDEDIPFRAGFLLGDGDGVGKGRTLAGFCYENIARGRNKHVWISVCADLYEVRILRHLSIRLVIWNHFLTPQCLFYRMQSEICRTWV